MGLDVVIAAMGGTAIISRPVLGQRLRQIGSVTAGFAIARLNFNCSCTHRPNRIPTSWSRIPLQSVRWMIRHASLCPPYRCRACLHRLVGLPITTLNLNQTGHPEGRGNRRGHRRPGVTRAGLDESGAWNEARHTNRNPQMSRWASA